MTRFCLIAALLFLLPSCGSDVDELVPAGDPAAVDPPAFGVDDWPWWRGANRDGKATGDHEYPLKWSKTENVVWKTDVPGEGLSSPILLGEKLFLTTGDEDRSVQSVLCYSRKTGDLLWRKDVHQGSLGKKGHGDSTFASATPACDGERVFAVFRNNGRIYVTALDLDGKQLWQTDVGEQSNRHGFGSSPCIYKELVIVAADSKGSGQLAALNRKDGTVHWRRPRPAMDSYATPVVGEVAGKDQLLMYGGQQVVSYDPRTGKENWSVEGSADITCGTMVWHDDLVYASGGYSQSETVGVSAGDSPEVAWKTRNNFYVSSMIVVDDVVHGFNHRGQGYSLDAADGSTIAKVRISSGAYGSPVLAGGRLYVPGRNGDVHVFEPKTLKSLATVSMGDAMDTTPTAAGGQLFLRVRDDDRDVLYCVGEKK